MGHVHGSGRSIELVLRDTELEMVDICELIVAVWAPGWAPRAYTVLENAIFWHSEQL